MRKATWQGWRPGRAAFSALMTVASLLALSAALPFASAAPKLMVYEAEVTAEPSIQGLDLPIVINARVGCGGACCYVVYGHNLKATISLPGNENGQNLSQCGEDQNPDRWLTSSGLDQGSVAAQPGGGLTWVTVSWEVNGSRYGTFLANVTITGTNEAGDDLLFTSSIGVTIAPGAAISSPMFSHQPVVGRDTPLVVSVSSTGGVRSVMLNLSTDNRTWRQIPMSPLSGGLWMASLPRADSELTYYFNMISFDNANEPFRTQDYTVKVTDPARITAISEGAAVIVAAGSLVGMLLILYFGSRRVSTFRSKGIFLVGDTGMEAALREREAMKESQRRITAIRWRVLAVLAVTTLVLFIVSILTGQLQMVIRHTTNPTEALIWLGR